MIYLCIEEEEYEEEEEEEYLLIMMTISVYIYICKQAPTYLFLVSSYYVIIN